MTASRAPRFPLLFIALLLPLWLAGAARAATAPLVSVLGTIKTGVRTPIRLAIDSAGTFYVTDPRGGGILRFNKAWTPLPKLVTPQPPQGIAIRGDGSLVVSQGNFAAIIDGSSGAEIRKLGSGVGQFQMANGIAILASGEIAVTDSLANQVKLFSPDGTNLLASFGGPGSGIAQLSQPTGITYEPDSGELAVVDTLNGRIQFFSAGGVFRREIGAAGSGPGKFTAPQGVAFEYDTSGALARIYVVDSFQSVIQVLDSSGTPLPVTPSTPYIGGYGTTAGKLVNPSDLVFDPLSRRLVVANTYGNLTLFGIDGGSNPIFTVTGSSVPQTTTATTLTVSGTLVPGTTVTVNGVPASVSGSTWTVTLTGLPLGLNQVKVVGTDSYGNTTTKFFPVTVVAPTQTVTPFDQIATISLPASGSTVTEPVQNVTGTVAAGISTVTVQVNGNPALTVPVLNGTFSAPLVLDGPTNTITFTAGGASTSRSLAFDPAFPENRITAPADGAVSNAGNGALTVGGTAPPGSTVTVRVNGAIAQTLTGSGSWSTGVTLRPGLNTIESQVTVAGKSSVAKISVTYDPFLALAIADPGHDLATGTAIPAISGTTSAASVAALLYDPQNAPSELPVTVQGGAFSLTPEFTMPGTYRLAITAIDGQGIAITTWRNFFFDSTPPALTLTPPSGTTISGTAENGAVVYVQNGTGANLVEPLVVSGGVWSRTLPAGYDPAAMNLFAVDAAGNSSRTGRVTSSNGTGSVSLGDALQALKIAAHQAVATVDNLLFGDVAPLMNGRSRPDGRIDIDDLLLILRRVVGLPWQ